MTNLSLPISDPVATAPAAAGWRSIPADPLPMREPQIVLTWIARLRWLAVAGQIVAVALAVWPLNMRPPLAPIGLLIGITIASNIVIQQWLARGATRAWVVSGVLVLDVALLTGLLSLTGGADNPFSTLYLVHVAMAVTVLQPRWTWLIIALTAICYAGLIWWHLPLSQGTPVPHRVLIAGDWSAVFIVAVLITYFSSRIRGALRQRDAELARIREHAARNEQLAALTTLAAGAAHELGTPLGTIAVVAKELELESQRTGSNTHVIEDAQLIRREVDRCRVILERMRVDILEDQPEARCVPVAEMADRIRGDLDADRVRRLDASIDPGVAQQRLPLRAIQQAVGVMLRNAFDAGDDTDRVVLRIEAASGLVVFRVTDRGRGMSDDVLRRAGEPFFTTKPPGRGMGLGLFLVRLVAEKYAGRLNLTSQPGRGTTAELLIPETACLSQQEQLP